MTTGLQEQQQQQQKEVPQTITNDSTEPSQSTTGGLSLPEDLLQLYQGAQKNLALKKYEDAVETLSQLAEKATAHFSGDSLHPEMGDIWFLYGQALCFNAIESNQVFGANEEQVEEEAGNYEEDAGPSNDAPAAEGVEIKEGAEAEQETDFETAWECLETARLIFEKFGAHSKLADTLVQIATLEMEEEKFSEAIEDLKEALRLKQERVEPYSRELAECLTLLCVAYENNVQYQEALDSMRSAVSCLSQRFEMLKSLKADENAAPVDLKGKGKLSAAVNPGLTLTEKQIKEELEDFETLLPEVNDKIKELEEMIKKNASKGIINEVPLFEGLGGHKEQEVQEGEEGIGFSFTFSGLTDQAKSKETPTVSAAANPPANVVVNDLTSMVKKRKKPDQ
jgi:tetratricopeptide (TPR) repeat protein